MTENGRDHLNVKSRKKKTWHRCGIFDIHKNPLNNPFILNCGIQKERTRKELGIQKIIIAGWLRCSTQKCYTGERDISHNCILWWNRYCLWQTHPLVKTNARATTPLTTASLFPSHGERHFQKTVHILHTFDEDRDIAGRHCAVERLVDWQAPLAMAIQNLRPRDAQSFAVSPGYFTGAWLSVMSTMSWSTPLKYRSAGGGEVLHVNPKKRFLEHRFT